MCRVKTGDKSAENFASCLIIYVLTDLNSSASGRRWASSDKIAGSPQGPILDDLLEVIIILCIW